MDMSEYEKPKRDDDTTEKPASPLGPNWFRQMGCLLILVAMCFWMAIPLIASPKNNAWAVLIFWVCGGLCFLVGMAPFIRYTASGERRPTLNQIRQNPDDPLIVQQWNGREWVDTLDMRAVAQQDQNQRVE